MKKIHVQCPICNKVDKIEEKKEYICSYCSSENKIYECKIKNIKDENREIEYLECCYKKAIISYNKEKTQKYLNILLNKDKNNQLVRYFMLNDINEKVEYLLNNKMNSMNIYFILKNDLLKNKKVNSSIVNSVIDKYNDVSEIIKLKDIIDKEYSEDKELYDSLKSEKVELKEYVDLNKHKFIGMFAMISAIIISIISAIICTFAVYDDCVYGTIVLIGIIPSIILTVGLIKYFKINNIILKVLIFTVSFYILTYLMTIHLRETSFINSFYDHIKHIVSAIPDVLESITKHSDIEWKEEV